jgi:hypothetical protein
MGMDQRQRRRDGSKRAQASRERRIDAKSRRKKMNIIYAMGAVALAAVAIAAIFLFQGGGTELGVSVSQLSGQHAPPYVYVQDVTIDGQPGRIPPTSGNHFAQQSSYGFLGTTVIPEAAVHNMEHGSIVIWYQPNDPELAGSVNALVKSLGNECIVAGSFADQSFQVTATVWGRALPQSTYNEAAMRAFISEYRGTEGPEAGLCRG